MKRIAMVAVIGLLGLTASSAAWLIPQVFSRLRVGPCGAGDPWDTAGR